MFRRIMAMAPTLVLGLAWTGTAALAAPPGITTKWASSSLPNKECVQMAERILRKLGFVHIDILGDSANDRNAFGDKGNYVVSVNCVTDKELVYIVVAGPETDQTEKLANRVLDSF